MGENIYDREAFFRQYSRMDRSVYGLDGAGEWHALKKLLPEFSGKRVLDLGCGFGWHCSWAADHGAVSVLGIELSEKMLAGAKQRNSRSQVTYRHCAIEAYEYPENTFDVVLSSLVLHYVADLDTVFRQVFRTLIPGGWFVFSVEHPVFTAEGRQDWLYDAEGKPLCWPVDHYFQEGKRNAVFLGEEMIKYHRTLTTYLRCLLNNGFVLEQLVEPEPDPALLDRPGMREELRRPMMLLAAARKKT
ncbi:MAG: methyltransferase domain-containing protein [Oscillospiraceae bacterium]|nr:methyltransferase domain-containing protein [Oscillospiraceae bacterium]